MIGNGIYCYISGFLKQNICKKTRYIVANKKFSGNLDFLFYKQKKQKNKTKIGTTGEIRSQRKRSIL